MVSLRRQRLKAIRAGVPVKEANACMDNSELVKMMMDLNIEKLGKKIKKDSNKKKVKQHGSK